jgi:hypothetical protein
MSIASETNSNENYTKKINKNILKIQKEEGFSPKKTPIKKVYLFKTLLIIKILL